MRRLGFSVSIFVLALQLAAAQDLPEFRPALVGKAPDAIINRIDTKTLAAAGQKNALIMFCAAVTKTGELNWSGTYRGTADSKLLEQEVQRALAGARMIPAIRHRQPIAVIFFGTVMFEVIEGKPRLRLFANQEPNELKTENDFVGPQVCIGGDSKFSGLHYPDNGSPVPLAGVAELQIAVDGEGNLQSGEVVNESPPLLGFGDAAMDDFAEARFIPAFRDGKPVACAITLPVYYPPKG